MMQLLLTIVLLIVLFFGALKFIVMLLEDPMTGIDWTIGIFGLIALLVVMTK